MNTEDAKKIINQMVSFIESEARSRAKDIKEKAEQEFTIESESIMSSAKEKIKNEYSNKIEQYGVKKRIEKSGALNNSRIKKMSSRNDCLLLVLEEAKDRMAEYFSKNKDEYKKFLSQLIIQGLVKLMEGEVVLKCREEDLHLVEEVKDESVKQYVKILKENVPRLKDKDVQCKVVIDKKNFLPHKQPKGSDLPSCSGGLVLHSLKGRIVCENTLESRLDLCYSEAIPEIRKKLFPNFY